MMFFEKYESYFKKPKIPFQYTHNYCFIPESFKKNQENLGKIIKWLKENVKDNLWYINKNTFSISELSNDQKGIYIDFDFANEEDLIAFKMRWK